MRIQHLGYRVEIRVRCWSTHKDNQIPFSKGSVTCLCRYTCFKFPLPTKCLSISCLLPDNFQALGVPQLSGAIPNFHHKHAHPHEVALPTQEHIQWDKGLNLLPYGAYLTLEARVSELQIGYVTGNTPFLSEMYLRAQTIFRTLPALNWN